MNHKSAHANHHGHTVAIIALFAMVILLAGGVLYYVTNSDKPAMPLIEEEKQSQMQAVRQVPNTTEPTSQKKEFMQFLREDIVPSIVAVECFDKNNEIMGRGSGFYFQVNGSHYVGTNAHVAVAPDKQFYGCYVYFPWSDGGFYRYLYYSDEAYFYYDQLANISDTLIWGIDYAELILNEQAQNPDQNLSPFPPPVEGFYAHMDLYCNTSRLIELGDKLYVLGYPAVGSDSLTITEGIVSGFLGDLSEWIKVSANINPGNSGGAAIAENGCFYGIPTQGISDFSGSIGQLLGAGYIDLFLSNNLGRIDLSNNQKIGSLIFERYENEELGFAISYPVYWELIEGYGSVGFESPQELVFDVQEGLIVKIVALSGTLTVEQELQSVLTSYADWGIEVISSQKRTFKGRPSLTLILPAEDGKQMTETYIIANDVAYILGEYIDAENPTHYSSVFKEMLDSFEILP